MGSRGRRWSFQFTSVDSPPTKALDLSKAGIVVYMLSSTGKFVALPCNTALVASSSTTIRVDYPTNRSASKDITSTFITFPHDYPRVQLPAPYLE